MVLEISAVKASKINLAESPSLPLYLSWPVECAAVIQFDISLTVLEILALKVSKVSRSLVSRTGLS